MRRTLLLDDETSDSFANPCPRRISFVVLPDSLMQIDGSVSQSPRYQFFHLPYSASASTRWISSKASRASASAFFASSVLAALAS